MKKFKLVIELVPSTSWGDNVRSKVNESEWYDIRTQAYFLAGNKCEICGEKGTDQGFDHHLECHEVWEYNNDKHIQKLIRFIALCPLCHKTKHIGFAHINGEYDLVMNHFCNVNHCTRVFAEKYIQECFIIWKDRSRYEWTVDISYLTNFKPIDPLKALDDKLNNL